MQRKLTILFCPLDWGLGHITRDLPLIQYCVNEGHKVIVAGSAKVIQIAQASCSNISTELFPGSEITYSEKTGIIAGLLLKLPQYLADFRNDHKKTEELVAKHQVDIVISDNRFGCYTKKAFSVYMTHQMNFELTGWARYFSFIPGLVHRSIIKKYRFCLIPDFGQTPRLAGKLSDKKRMKMATSYIGILSRFEQKPIDRNSEVVILLGGPEPYRTQLEHIVINQANAFHIPVTIIQGRPENGEQTTTIGLVKRIGMLTGHELEERLLSARTIICRSGYSSLMDLVALNRTAVIIPTPGQPEQEYLAKYLHENNYFTTMAQQEFDLREATQKKNHLRTFGKRSKPVFPEELQKIFNQVY